MTTTLKTLPACPEKQYCGDHEQPRNEVAALKSSWLEREWRDNDGSTWTMYPSVAAAAGMVKLASDTLFYTDCGKNYIALIDYLAEEHTDAFESDTVTVVLGEGQQRVGSGGGVDGEVCCGGTLMAFGWLVHDLANRGFMVDKTELVVVGRASCGSSGTAAPGEDDVLTLLVRSHMHALVKTITWRVCRRCSTDQLPDGGGGGGNRGRITCQAACLDDFSTKVVNTLLLDNYLSTFDNRRCDLFRYRFCYPDFVQMLSTLRKRGSGGGGVESGDDADAGAPAVVAVVVQYARGNKFQLYVRYPNEPPAIIGMAVHDSRGGAVRLGGSEEVFRKTLQFCSFSGALRENDEKDRGAGLLATKMEYDKFAGGPPPEQHRACTTTFKGNTLKQAADMLAWYSELSEMVNTHGRKDVSGMVFHSLENGGGGGAFQTLYRTLGLFAAAKIDATFGFTTYLHATMHHGGGAGGGGGGQGEQEQLPAQEDLFNASHEKCELLFSMLLVATASSAAGDGGAGASEGRAQRQQQRQEVLLQFTATANSFTLSPVTVITQSHRIAHLLNLNDAGESSPPAPSPCAVGCLNHNLRSCNAHFVVVPHDHDCGGGFKWHAAKSANHVYQVVQAMLWIVQCGYTVQIVPQVCADRGFFDSCTKVTLYLETYRGVSCLFHLKNDHSGVVLKCDRPLYDVSSDQIAAQSIRDWYENLPAQLLSKRDGCRGEKEGGGGEGRSTRLFSMPMDTNGGQCQKLYTVINMFRLLQLEPCFGYGSSGQLKSKAGKSTAIVGSSSHLFHVGETHCQVLFSIERKPLGEGDDDGRGRELLFKKRYVVLMFNTTQTGFTLEFVKFTNRIEFENARLDRREDHELYQYVHGQTGGGRDARVPFRLYPFHRGGNFYKQVVDALQRVIVGAGFALRVNRLSRQFSDQGFDVVVTLYEQDCGSDRTGGSSNGSHTTSFKQIAVCQIWVGTHHFYLLR